MANQSQRGGLQKTRNQTGSETVHQGVHPGSTTESERRGEKRTGSKHSPGADPHAGEQVVPKKDHYASDE